MDNTLTLKCTTYYSQSCLMKLDTNSFDQWNCDTLGPQQCQTFVLQSPAPTTNIPTLNPIIVAPTTAIPTTNMPTTLIPTTVTPTTSNPTSLSPTTITPTTMLPTTINPTTSIPTTLIPSSIHPTSNPTKTCLNGIYAVTFTLQFTYDYLIENVSDHAVYNLLVNLSIALIKSETNTIENIISTNYNITLNKIYNLATINIIIYACNKDTINLLAIHIADNLQTDFLLLTNSNTILLIVSDNINILSVSIIDNGNGEIFETSHQLISTTHQIIFNNKYKNDNSSFIMIMIIIGTSIFCCILCIVCYIIFRVKKDHAKYMENNINIQPHKSTATGYQIDKQISQPQSRQRVQTESIYIEDNDDDKKHNAQIELTDNVTSISVMSNEFKNDNSQMDRKMTTDTDNGMEIYMDDHETNGKETIGNVALRTLQNISSNSLKNIQNQLAAIPHSPIKEVKIFNYDKIKIRSGSMEGQPETKIELNNHGNDVINYDNDNHIEIKNWLEISCGTSVCEQYFAVFISNGYESLDFITQMNNKSDLKDIGIELKGHQTKIWSEITKLKTTPK